jgi:O-antigen ligase
MSLSQRPRSRVILALAGLTGLALLGFSVIFLNLSPITLLAGLLGGSTVLTLMFRPILGVHLLIILLSVENLFYTSEGLTVMKAAGVIVVAGWLLGVVTSRRLGVRMSALIVGLVLFVGWTAVTMVTAFDSQVALVRVLTFAQLGFVTIMFASVIQDVERLRGVLRTTVISTTLAGIYALALYFEGVTTVAAGTVLDRNQLAVNINIAIVCAYILYQVSHSAAERAALLVALPILFLSLALSFSRGGYITFVVALFLVMYRVAKTRGYVVLAGSLAMIALISTTLPDSFYQRVSSIVPSIEHQEDTFGIRVLLWKAGLRMIADNPVLGVGPGNFMLAQPHYVHGRIYSRFVLTSHNLFIGVAAETGLVGLGLYLFMVVAAFREAGRPGRKWSPGARDLELAGVGVEICIVVILMGGLTGSAETSKYLFMLFGMASTVGRLALARTSVTSRAASDDSSYVAHRADPALHPMPGR